MFWKCKMDASGICEPKRPLGRAKKKIPELVGAAADFKNAGDLRLFA
jgi:hypothetical protein